MKTQAIVTITKITHLSALRLVNPEKLGEALPCTFYPSGTLIEFGGETIISPDDCIVVDMGRGEVGLNLDTVEYTIEHTEPLDRTPQEDTGVPITFSFTGITGPEGNHRVNRDTTAGKIYTGKRYDVGQLTINFGLVLPADKPMVVFNDDNGDEVVSYLDAYEGLGVNYAPSV